ncbi:hypothetical protein TGRUB_315970 [Toxoplasma gondii RUB]|uniref:Uncharacterized protein n=1 Tax=Toxoplasma gondii RUB TaxID=935652 RepID=A0A086MBY5_TOXGO|nr:hypothetical protein TGRUB_315970 [Toxoplasma gondii RUB]
MAMQLPADDETEGQSEDNRNFSAIWEVPAPHTESLDGQLGVLLNNGSLTDREEVTEFQPLASQTGSAGNGNDSQMDVASEELVSLVKNDQGQVTSTMAETSTRLEATEMSLPSKSESNAVDEATATATPEGSLSAPLPHARKPTDEEEYYLGKVGHEEQLKRDTDTEHSEMNPEGTGVLHSRAEEKDAAHADSEGDRAGGADIVAEMKGEQHHEGLLGEGGEGMLNKEMHIRKEVDSLKGTSAKSGPEGEAQKQQYNGEHDEQVVMSPALLESTNTVTPTSEQTMADIADMDELEEIHETTITANSPSIIVGSEPSALEPAEVSERAYEPSMGPLDAASLSTSEAAPHSVLSPEIVDTSSSDQQGTVSPSSGLSLLPGNLEGANVTQGMLLSGNSGDQITDVPSPTESGHIQTVHPSHSHNGLMEPASHQDLHLMHESRGPHEMERTVLDAESGILPGSQLHDESGPLLGVLPAASSSHSGHGFVHEGSHIFTEPADIHGLPDTGMHESIHSTFPMSAAHEAPLGVFGHGVISSPEPTQTNLLPPMATAVQAIQSPFLAHETSPAFSTPMHVSSSTGELVTVPGALAFVQSEEAAATRGGKKKGGNKNKKSPPAVVYESKPGPMVTEHKPTVHIAEPIHVELQEKPKKRSRRAPI